MKIDKVEAISSRQLFGDVEVAYGSGVPSSPSEGMLWFEPGSVFNPPWSWNSTESQWMSAPFVLDYGYTNFSISTIGASSWVNRTVPFYSVTGNRIFIKHVFGNLYNTGNVAHNSDLFYTFFLDRFLGSGLMASTLTISPNTVDMAAVSYFQQTTPEPIPDRPNSASLRRITQTDVNLWMPGNTWYQRLRATRGGVTTGNSGSIAISLIQIIQFARLTP
jgi:hypothetical protein